MAEVQKSTNSADSAARFIEFVMLQAQNASLFLGLMPHPQSGQAETNLELARMFIDQLAMIQEKTRGNLSAEESSFLNGTLSKLQMAFVEVAQGGGDMESVEDQPSQDDEPAAACQRKRADAGNPRGPRRRVGGRITREQEAFQQKLRQLGSFSRHRKLNSDPHQTAERGTLHSLVYGERPPARDRGRCYLSWGPCVIESEDFLWRTARQVQAICRETGADFVFKASYDKANRTSGRSYRGMPAREGCALLAAVGRELGVAVTTDVHSPAEAEMAAEFIDVLQIPAFLCRQTDLIEAAARTGRVVNVKKGQFLSPWDVRPIARKSGRRAARGFSSPSAA